MIPLSLVRAAAADWPDDRWPYWIHYNDANSVKRASRSLEGLPLSCQLVLQRMAETDMCEYGDCFPDLTLHGGGLHEIPPGGWLRSHRDSTHHPNFGWSRVASSVLFVDDWNAEWGGELEADGKLIVPERGKLVVIKSCVLHGVHPVTGPRPRRTVSLFWWTTNEVHSERRGRAQFA